ncbi:MAG: hypothetical protein J5903_02335, partial [Clostridia bacterium]|nr:hypothetical protein [Clostridia bacterium]
MNKTNKFDLKAFLTFLTVIVLSFAMLFATACNKSSTTDDDESDGDTETEETSDARTDDKQTLLNGDFEFYTASTATYPVYSTSSSSAYKWQQTKGGGSDNYAVASSGKSGIIDTADDAYGKLSDAEKPKNADDTYYNPKTPYAENLVESSDDDVADVTGSKILMIHNKTTAGTGTAQYFVSTTTITLAADKYALLSVWVKTKDLSGYKGADDYGAYVKVTSSVTPQVEPLVVNNIDTAGVWTKYSVYLKPSRFVTTTYKLTLGLGEGDSINKYGYTEGFAYFDNAEYKLIDKDAYDAAVTAGAPVLTNDEAVTPKAAYTIDDRAIGAAERVLAMDFSKAETPVAITGNGDYNADISINPLNVFDKVGYGDVSFEYDGETIDATDAIYMVFDGKDANGNQLLGSSYTYKTDVLGHIGGADETDNYLKFTFKAKVINKSFQKGATVTLVDGETETDSFSNFNTVDKEGDDDGFVTYSFYLVNNYAINVEGGGVPEVFDFSFNFTFGSTSYEDGSLLYPQGYAIFKDFTLTALTKAEYNAASTGDASVKVEVKGAHANAYSADTDDDGDDAYTYNVSATDKEKMENGQLIPVESIKSNAFAVVKADGAEVGLVNSHYAYADASLSNALTAMNSATWERDNEYVQPIAMIGVADEETYLKGEIKTIAQGSTYTFSLKVYAGVGAEAFVRIYKVKTLGSEGEYLKDTDGNAVTVTVKNGATKNKDGYVNVKIVIVADEELTLRLEFGTNTAGAVLFDEVNDGSSSTDTYGTLKAAYYPSEYTFTEKKSDNTKIYYYKTEDDAKEDKNRIQENGADKYTIAEGQVVLAFGKPATDNADDDNFVQFVNFGKGTTYVIEPDETDTEDETDDEEEEDEDQPNTAASVWLSVISIVLALVLIAALVTV